MALTGPGGPGTAQATARADFGTLGVFATASANGGEAFPVIGASAAASFTDDIFIGELRAADLYDKVSQAFAVFLPVKSVGVVGDARAYEWVIALRAVETIDFMTAHWAHLPYDFLGEVSNRIINELRGISRVVYDVSGKPPATIEWE